jgi:hypothetical protein
MQEKSEQNFLFNTQMQEKSVENSFWIAVKALIAIVFQVDSVKGGIGDILQSDISQVQLNTLLGNIIIRRDNRLP